MTVMYIGQWSRGNNGGDVGEWRKKAGENPEESALNVISIEAEEFS